MTCYFQLKNKTLTVLKSFLFVVIFSLINLTCLTQTNDIELLKKEIKNSNNEKTKVDLINNFCKKKYFEGATDSIFPFFQQAIVLAEKINYQKGLFNSYINLGNTYLVLGEKDQALTAYKKALILCRGYQNRKQEADIIENIGLVYESMDNYKKALSQSLASLRIKESINYHEGIARSYDNMGIIYINVGNYTKSLNYFKKSLKIKQELGDSALMANTIHNIALVYETMLKYRKAIKTYLLAIKIKKEQKLIKDLAISYNNIGSCYNELNLKDSAIFYHKKSFEINRQTKNNKGIALSAHALTHDFFDLNELDSAKFYSRIAVSKATKRGYLYIKKSAFDLVSKIYENQKKLDSALIYSRLSQVLNDSIYNQDSQRTIAEMSTIYETEKKEIENKNLLSQNKIKSLEIYNQRIFISSLFVLILVIIFVSWLIFSRKDLKQKELLKSELLNQQEIRTKSIIEGQEIERKRVAMDLHDGVGQTLAGVKMNMASMIDREEFSKEVITEKIISTMQLVDGAYKEVRDLAHQMMPKTLRDRGLEEALEGLLEKALADTPMMYAFERNNYTRLDENIELVLYRVFQEILTNILKHAKATKIIINLHITKLHIILMVEDNGVGIELNEEKFQGIGLSNIQARIAIVNGTFSINKGETEGTIAVIRIPFNQKYLVI